MDGRKVTGPLSNTLKALLPENIFLSSPTAVDMAISHRQPSSDLHFLKLSMYLISNNFFGPTTDVSTKVYQWVKHHSNAGLMEYILSIGGPTVEALAEHLFRLALDAEDVRTINKMMKLGINPNEQVCRTEWGTCRTPLLHACDMQSLKLVKALIGGGAKVDHSVGNEDAELVLMFALNCRDEDGKLKAHVDPELVQILLNAGAVINPSSGESPLASAAEWGHVEVVNLLVSAGADVNIAVCDGGSTSTPLINAIGYGSDIPDGEVISVVRILLLAGADPNGVAVYDGQVETPLEAAMRRESIELIQLLLGNGTRVSEQSFVKAVSCCDINVVKLLLNSGGQVTESAVECAVEYNSTMVFFLLEITDKRIKERCKTAALIKSIACGKMALIQELGVSGAQLIQNYKLEAAIRQVITAGNTPVLRFLLDEKSGYRTLSLESLDTGLWTAIKNHRNDIVRLLLGAGANVNSRNGGLYESPLLEAIIKEDSNLAKQLLVAGAAVNDRYERWGIGSGWYSANTSIKTVLSAVVDWGYYPLIQDIINASGAVLSGQTALLAASRNNDLPTVRYLLELGAYSDEGSLVAGITGSVELVQTLLEARLHRYKRYSRGYGCGALQHAIELRDATMIKLLLAKGIDANAIFNRKVGD
jgi:ankyrin repeat protein